MFSSYKSLKSRKSQLTVFFILGLVILVVFMILLFTVKSVKTTQVRKEAKQAINSFIETSTIHQYTLSCANAVFDDGLEKITMQGGVLYNDQFVEENLAIPNDNTYVEINLKSLPIANNPYEDEEKDKLVNVSYAMFISENIDSPLYIPGAYANPPLYPTPFRTLGELNGFNNYLGNIYAPLIEGFYGENHLPKLCEEYSECKYDSYIFDNTDGADISIQKQLENYIESHVKECVNFTYFESLTPYTIEEGNVTADIKFGVDKITLTLDYPITMIWRQGQPVTQILNFNTNRNNRLAKIYRLAHTILKYESFDLFFDPLSYKSIFGISPYFSCRMSDRSRCYDSQISVHKVPNIDNNPATTFDDLVVIVDNATQINGKPMMFQFMIENRRPALDYISYHPNELIDFIVFENQTILLNPVGYDPDNDTIQEYHYSGWREDYYTVFNKTKWYSLGGWDTQTNYSCCIQTYQNQTRNWTQSSRYLLTEQNASYHVKYGELGYHNVTIAIWDEQGLRDWQSIKILVRDLPKAVAIGSNNYALIGNNNASVEDPYNLSANHSFAVFNALGYENNKFLWKEEIDGIDIVTEETNIVIPYNPFFDIMDILPLAFTQQDFNEMQLREIMLRVGVILGDVENTILYGEPDYLNIELHQCLPHVNEVYPLLPYPYSESLANPPNPFQATHVCCNDGSLGTTWGTVKDNDEDCFNVIEYATLDYFESNTNDWYDEFEPIVGQQVEYIGLIVDIDEENNIFKRTFERECDGTRGNLCVGDADATISSEVSCYGLLADHQEKRCYGPTENYFNSVQSMPEECIIYDETTNFEQLIDNSISDECSVGPACYSATAINPIFQDGEFLVADDAETTYSASQLKIKCESAYCSSLDYETQRNTATGDCSRVEGNLCSCSDECGGSSDCNEKDPGIYFEDPNNSDEEIVCNINCEVADCGYYDFDPTIFDCSSSCENNIDCADNYFCDSANENDDCYGCDYGTHTQIGGTLSGVCRANCNAPSSFCEGVMPVGICANC
jgi:hypothetical protein